MNRKLTLKERHQLVERHRGERKRKVCDRIKAVLMYDDGYSYSEIARVLLIDDETVRRHIEDYLQQSKLSGASGGSASRLTRCQTQQLLHHLNEKTYRYVKDICAYVYTRYGVVYSASGMTSWLKRGGFRYKKPQPVPGKVDPEQQERFVHHYAQLKQSNSGPIYFVDSVHPQHQTRLAYGWIKKGLRKAIATTGKQKRLNIMGALCLTGHRLVVQASEKIDAKSIKRFLAKLRAKHQSQELIHVVWDNAGYHRSKDVQAYAQERGIQLHFLPPYSPNLNPIERLWKVMHEQVTYNRYYEKFADSTEAITDFFKKIGRKKALLRQRISDKFQIVSRPNFAF